VAPKVAITGPTRFEVAARENSHLASWPKKPSEFAQLSATDAVAPAGVPPPVISCRAAVDGGAEVDVTPAGTEFPYGVTTVTCTAADAAGNVGPGVAFTVSVSCEKGYGFKDGKCQSEWRRARACGLAARLDIP
jgi:hypothetical protein